MQRLFAALAVVAAAQGCIGDPACTNSGVGSLLISSARLPSVARIRTEGNCSVGAVPPTCSAAPRCVEWQGEQLAQVVVTGTARGTCTLHVDFNDGCASETYSIEFGGPYENCCESVCAKPRPEPTVPSACGG